MKNILKNLLVVSLTVMSPLAAMAATFTLSSPDFTSGHPMPVAMGGSAAGEKLPRAEYFPVT